MRLERPGLPLHGPDRKLDLPVYLQLHDHLAGMIFFDALLPYTHYTHYTKYTTLPFLLKGSIHSILFYSLPPTPYITLPLLPYPTFTPPLHHLTLTTSYYLPSHLIL